MTFKTGNGTFKLTDVLSCCQKTLFQQQMKSPDINPLIRVYVSRNFTDHPFFIVIRTWTYSRLLWKRSCSLNSRDSASTSTSPSFCFRSLTFKICSLLLTSSLKTKLLVFLACFSSPTSLLTMSVELQSSLALVFCMTVKSCCMCVCVCVCFPAASEDGVVAYTREIIVFSRSFNGFWMVCE